TRQIQRPSDSVVRLEGLRIALEHLAVKGNRRVLLTLEVQAARLVDRVLLRERRNRRRNQEREKISGERQQSLQGAAMGERFEHASCNHRDRNQVLPIVQNGPRRSGATGGT